jgi:predicted phage tail protein
MALSEHEQRMLDEMERQLYQSDADVLSTSRPAAGKPDYRAIVVGSVIAVVGLVTLLGGVMMNQMAIGILGFAAMLAGVLYVFSPKKTATSTQHARNAESRGSAPRASRSFTERMEQRWQQREDGQR